MDPSDGVLIIGYISAALKGKYVGIEEQGNGIWKVFYRNVFLGFYNE